MKQEKREAMLKGRPYRPDLKKEAGESGGEKKHTSGVVPFRHRPITKHLAVSCYNGKSMPFDSFFFSYRLRRRFRCATGASLVRT